jgi:hypothetical protein
MVQLTSVFLLAGLVVSSLASPFVQRDTVENDVRAISTSIAQVNQAILNLQKDPTSEQNGAVSLGGSLKSHYENASTMISGV